MGTSELGRRAKFYRLTRQGRQQLASGTEAWAAFAAAVNKVLAPPVARAAVTPVGIGLLVGAAGALATGGLLENQLFDVGARDPVALASIVGAMLIVGVVAGTLPAMRAAPIDPSRALHEG